MNTFRQINLLLSLLVMALHISPFIATAQAQSEDSEQEWYSCILKSKNSEMSVNTYTEIYNPHNSERDSYILYNHDGYHLHFVPDRSRLILHSLTGDIQFQGHIDLNKYDNNRYFEETVEVSVHDGLSLNVNCNIDRPPTLRKNETEAKYWRFNYSFPSHSESHCQIEENRNQLHPTEEVFALEDILGEYPETFQIPMSVEYGKPFDHYMGVVAYGNKKGGKYQCTELVHRFFKNVYNVPTRIGLGLGHGKDLSFNLTGFSNTHNPTVQIEPEEEIKLRFIFFDNGCSSQLPTPGSSISFSWSNYGHVAIVRRVEALSDEMVLLHLFQQAGLRSEIQDSRYLLVKDNNGFWRGRSVRGWSVPVIQQ
ncbi:MAG: CHAP domain-containing protein [Bdellovibrionales bacterium]|nr:CHAP domain-containing protein [Bdellovibrionales bacterium]